MHPSAVGQNPINETPGVAVGAVGVHLAYPPLELWPDAVRYLVDVARTREVAAQELASVPADKVGALGDPVRSPARSPAPLLLDVDQGASARPEPIIR
jgi:hypothetical protein